MIGAKKAAALAEAYAEAAGHLRLEWTEDPLEKLCGMEVARRLDQQADRYFELAEDGRE